MNNDENKSNGNNSIWINDPYPITTINYVMNYHPSNRRCRGIFSSCGTGLGNVRGNRSSQRENTVRERVRTLTGTIHDLCIDFHIAFDASTWSKLKSNLNDLHTLYLPLDCYSQLCHSQTPSSPLFCSLLCPSLLFSTNPSHHITTHFVPSLRHRSCIGENFGLACL